MLLLLLLGELFMMLLLLLLLWLLLLLLLLCSSSSSSSSSSSPLRFLGSSRSSGTHHLSRRSSNCRHKVRTVVNTMRLSTAEHHRWARARERNVVQLGANSFKATPELIVAAAAASAASASSAATRKGCTDTQRSASSACRGCRALLLLLLLCGEENRLLLGEELWTRTTAHSARRQWRRPDARTRSGTRGGGGCGCCRGR